MTTPFIATCRCGSFTFESSRAPFLQLTCHCQQCRTASAAPFTNFAFFKLAEAKVSGASKVHAFVADSGSKTVREACASCGDVMVDRSEAFPQMIGIVADRLQAPYEFQPRCHVWLESKVADVAIPENMKTFARGMQ
jgi:hypothetical protein